MAKDKKELDPQIYPEDNKFFAYDGSMETFKADPITAEDLEELAILREMLYSQGSQGSQGKQAKKEKKQG